MEDRLEDIKARLAEVRKHTPFPQSPAVQDITWLVTALEEARKEIGKLAGWKARAIEIQASISGEEAAAQWAEWVENA